jgi:hypothetical protein
VIDDWTPITEEELLLRLEAETGQLSVLDQRNFDTWQVSIGTRGRVARFSTDAVEEVFIVARTGSIVVFFDDIEDEFATGIVDDEGNILHPGLCGELRDALRNVVARTA